MRDKHDAHTRDMIRESQLTPNARRQAAYRESQLKQGRKQRSYWLSDAEAAAIKQLLTQMRGTEDADD